MRKPRYTEADVERAKNQGWRKGYADGVSVRKARDEANELGYAARLARLKKRHANELREAQDQARNHGYRKGYESGVRKMERNNRLAESRAEKKAYAKGFLVAAKIGNPTEASEATAYQLDEEYRKGYKDGKKAGACFSDHDGLYNDGYAAGREHGFGFGYTRGQRATEDERNRLYNNGYAVGREEAQGTIKAERKDYIDQIKRSAKAAGELDGYERAIRILKNNSPEVLPF